jgi:hypothetical protein
LDRHWRRSKIKTHAEANLFLEKASGEENAPQDTFFQSVYSATGTPYFLIQARNTPAAAQIVSSFPIRGRAFPLASSTMFILVCAMVSLHSPFRLCGVGGMISEKEMTVHVPKEAIAAPGTAALVLKNPTRGGGKSNALTVTIQ